MSDRTLAEQLEALPTYATTLSGGPYLARARVLELAREWERGLRGHEAEQRGAQAPPGCEGHQQ